MLAYDMIHLPWNEWASNIAFDNQNMEYMNNGGACKCLTMGFFLICWLILNRYNNVRLY